jgi:hypothetical protein
MHITLMMTPMTVKVTTAAAAATTITTKTVCRLNWHRANYEISTNR